MSNMRDELFHALVGGAVKESDGAAWQYNAIEAAAILDGLMPTIDRALAAERAATIEECRRIVRTRRDSFGTLNDALGEILALGCDRSALDEMLAQARREQREKDARIVETAAGCNCAAVDIGVGTLHEQACGLVRPEDAAAAIRAQED